MARDFLLFKIYRPFNLKIKLGPRSGPKPKGKVAMRWSSNFAYAIELIATDGNLSPDGRHISFTSKDLEQINNYKTALGINNSIGVKNRGYNNDKIYYVVQFSDVLFYDFLLSIGLTPAKSKTLGTILIPDEFFFDFLRGGLDGDGYSYSYWDKRWRSSFLFYVVFVSASINHIKWIQQESFARLSISGHITKSVSSSCFQLKYSKNDAKKLVGKIYDTDEVLYLSRKKLKIQESLAIMGKLSIGKGTSPKVSIDREMREWRN